MNNKIGVNMKIYIVVEDYVADWDSHYVAIEGAFKDEDKANALKQKLEEEAENNKEPYEYDVKTVELK